MQRSVCPHENMDDVRKINEKSLPMKGDLFFLNMKGITVANYMHSKKVYKCSKIKL